MAKTTPTDWIGKRITGYLIGALLSKDSQVAIVELLNALKKETPWLVWSMPPQALHITLCEIVVPLQTYSEDKDKLYRKNQAVYDNQLTEIFKNTKVFKVTFNNIEASENAIIVRGKDS